jgi:DNA polymerase III subunit gamma/tau
MSYQVLARKWRPRTFKEMVGQTHVLQVLTNALDNNRLHHAYLFTGTRGIGKTTLARIMAKCLNCEQGVSSKPCGSCSACISIDEGRFVDLIEVDAASRAKVDETRDLMDNVQYAPTVGRYKIYLIDEVHMFSNHSFNALLKTLEEPPPHVKFLLATTEAKKIPVTILSRCLQFNLKLLGVDLIEQQITKVLKDENITADEVSRHLIAVSAEGSMRDALSLLDQAISYCGGELHEDQVRTMLGTIDSRELSALLHALVEGNVQHILELVDQLAQHDPDFDAVLVELLSCIHKIAVTQMLSNDNRSDEQTDLAGAAAKLSKEDVQLYYQIGLAGRRDLALAPDPRSGFEMILIRMIAFRPAQSVLHRQLAYENAGTGSPATVEQSIPESQPENAYQFNSNNSTAEFQTPVSDKSVDRINPDDWQDVIDEMALAGLVKELAGNCVLKEHTKEKIHLVIPPTQEHLLNTSQKERLNSALKTRFGQEIKIIMTVENPNGETPVQKKDRVQQETQLAAEHSVENDPNLRVLQDLFDATIDKKSIRSGSN